MVKLEEGKIKNIITTVNGEELDRSFGDGRNIHHYLDKLIDPKSILYEFKYIEYERESFDNALEKLLTTFKELKSKEKNELAQIQNEETQNDSIEEQEPDSLDEYDF